MHAIQLPSEKEIRAAYQEGEDAVVLLLRTTLLVLTERIQKLEDELAKNSRVPSMKIEIMEHCDRYAG